MAYTDEIMMMILTVIWIVGIDIGCDAIHDNYDDNKARAVKCFRDNKTKTKEFCLWAKSERWGYFLFVEMIFLILKDTFLFSEGYNKNVFFSKVIT